MVKKKAAPCKSAGAKRAGKPSAKKSTPAKVPVPSASARAFAEFLDEFGLNGPPPAPLVNITFFLGAGFSKAWDPSYPTGAELFQLTRRERQHS